MKKQTLVISAIAALIAVSCSKSEQQAGVQGQAEYIRPTSSIAGTKALVSDNSAVLTDLKFLHKMDVAGLTDPAISFAGLTAIDGSRAASGAITLSPAQPYDKVGDKTSYLLGYTGTGATLTANEVTWTNTGIDDILITNGWDAGTYLLPKTTGMTLSHALSRIEVICAANSASDLDVIKGTWGNITGIKFKDAPTTLVLDCANNTSAAGAIKANLPLNSGNTYTSVGFTAAPIAANGSTAVMASAMIPPTQATTCKLIVSSALMSDMEVDVEFKDAQNTAIACKAGMIHLITLNFNVKDKTIQAQTTSITEWTNGGTSEDPVIPPPPPMPAIGDYYYSDNSYSTTYALPPGQTLLGVVYRVNPDGTGMLVEVTEYKGSWSTVLELAGASSEDNGVVNTAIIKGLADWETKYPVFKYCEGKNIGGVTGWYLPSNKELRALYAGYCGLRWMASGADTANGEIDDWGNNAVMLNNANYADKRTEFNVKLNAASAVGGIGFVGGAHWSAMESTAGNAWYVYFTNGNTTNSTKSTIGSKARCVREF